MKYIESEIKLLEKQIEKEMMKPTVVTDQVVGSDVHFPYSKHSVVISGVNNYSYSNRLNMLNKKLNNRLNKLITQREQLEEYIVSIDDSLIRQIMTLRYVEGMGWKQVAQNIGGGNTADSVRMIHNRHLEG